jgi:hypothetical protein
VLLSVIYIDVEIFASAICRANEVSQLNSGMNPRDGGSPSSSRMASPSQASRQIRTARKCCNGNILCG